MNTPANQSIFIVGPAYCGKSSYANQQLDPRQKSLAIGTSQIQEEKHVKSIQTLQEMRPTSCALKEIHIDLPEAIKLYSQTYNEILVDSINQWIGNIIMSSIQKYDTAQLENILEEEKSSLLKSISSAHSHTCRLIIVSSEQGSCPSPARELDRIFRMFTGKINMEIAMLCQNVIQVNVGIPTKIK